MLKYDINVDESFKLKIMETLNVRDTDSYTLEETVSYLYINIQVMDRMIEGFNLWLGDRESEGMTPTDFIKAFLVMMEKFRKNMESRDGIIYDYVSRLNQNPAEIPGKVQPWQYEGMSGSYRHTRGIYQSLLNMGLKADFIDCYYLDGSLMEIYEDALESVSSLNNLVKTSNPGINDIRDGLLIVDERFRKLYNKLFIEQFEDVYGVFGALITALKEIEKNNERKGSLE
jgi:predicted DNA-binding protein YlxM (UPF0122 family)